jgi:hypothetical protein
MKAAANDSLDTDNAFDTVCAVRCALSSTNRANPLRGPALQVKLMLARRRKAAPEE